MYTFDLSKKKFEHRFMLLISYQLSYDKKFLVLKMKKKIKTCYHACSSCEDLS